MRFKVFALLILVVMATISCTQNSQEVSTLQLTTVVHPDWVKDATMYEVNIRQYTPEGTFNAFSAHLPRLKELGVDILWLMPIHPIGEINRKGSLGSYYSVRDYKGINPEFGNMDDFKALVRMTHDLGMFMVIDWVPNHSAWDNPLVTEHPEWYAKDSSGNMFSPFDWTDVVQFDYDQQGLRDYMTGTLQWWLNETGIDGFRFDVAHQVPIDFWNDLRPDLQKVRPDVLMLAEAENRALHEDAFDITYAWEFHHISNSVAKNEKSVADIRAYLEKSKKEYNDNDIRMYFTSNHDENSWNGTVWERLGPAAGIMAVLTYGIPGMPLIYSGQEAGLDHRLLFFEKDEITWKDHPFNDLYKNLNALKKRNPALWNPGFGGYMTEISNDQPDKVLSFNRQKGDNEVIFVFNLSDQDVSVKLSGIAASSDYTDFSDNQTEVLNNPSFELHAWEYKIFYR